MDKIYIIVARDCVADENAIESVAYANKQEAIVQANAVMDQFRKEAVYEHPDKLIKNVINADHEERLNSLLLFTDPFSPPLILAEVRLKELVLKS